MKTMPEWSGQIKNRKLCVHSQTWIELLATWPQIIHLELLKELSCEKQISFDVEIWMLSKSSQINSPPSLLNYITLVDFN